MTDDLEAKRLSVAAALREADESPETMRMAVEALVAVGLLPLAKWEQACAIARPHAAALYATPPAVEARTEGDVARDAAAAWDEWWPAYLQNGTPASALFKAGYRAASRPSVDAREVLDAGPVSRQKYGAGCCGPTDYEPNCRHPHCDCDEILNRMLTRPNFITNRKRTVSEIPPVAHEDALLPPLHKGYSAEFWHDEYARLSEAVLEHLVDFVHDGEEFEACGLVNAIERAAKAANVVTVYSVTHPDDDPDDGPAYITGGYEDAVLHSDDEFEGKGVVKELRYDASAVLALLSASPPVDARPKAEPKCAACGDRMYDNGECPMCGPAPMLHHSQQQRARDAWRSGSVQSPIDAEAIAAALASHPTEGGAP